MRYRRVNSIIDGRLTAIQYAVVYLQRESRTKTRTWWRTAAGWIGTYRWAEEDGGVEALCQFTRSVNDAALVSTDKGFVENLPRSVQHFHRRLDEQSNRSCSSGFQSLYHISTFGSASNIYLRDTNVNIKDRKSFILPQHFFSLTVLLHCLWSF